MVRGINAIRMFHALVLVAGTLVAGCRHVDRDVVRANSERRGDEFAAADKWAQAAAAYGQAVNAEPGDGPLRVKLAKALERAGQWTPSATQAMRAADLLPDDFDAQFLAARLVLGQSRFDDSLTITTALLRRRPADPDLLVLWGTATARLISPTWALFSLGPTGGTGPDYERGCTKLRPPVGPDQDAAAETALRRAAELVPASVDVRLSLLNFLWAARRADESEALIRALAEEQPEHGLINEIAGYFFLARRHNDLGERYLARAATAAASYSHAPRLALADHFLATGQFESALTHLRELTPADDEGGVIAVRRAEAQLGLNRHDLAEQEIDAILQRYPKHRRGLALRARLLVKLGRQAEAQIAAREAVAADRTSAEARAVLADTLTTAGDLDGAFTEYAEALRLDPARTTLVPILADLALATGRIQPALAFARQAVGLFPDDVGAKVAVAAAQVRLHDYAAAATALAPLLSVRPRPLAVHVLLGQLESGRGRDAAARAAFTAALAVDANSLEALTGLVDLELSRGQVPAARRRIDAAMDRRPDDAAVLKLASRVFRAEHDLAGEETVLRRALARQPADTEAALLLADTLVARASYDEARTLLERVLARSPSSAPARTALGTVLERLGRPDDAEAHYKHVLATYPGNGPAATRLALLDAARGRNLDVALGHLSEAKRTSPDDPGVSDALGWVYLQKNLRLLAVEHLEEAIRLSPRTPLFHYHLGVAYARTGAVAKARAALTRALALDPGAADRRNAETALAALAKP